jgi:type IV pilus assembly protein PilC
VNATASTATVPTATGPTGAAEVPRKRSAKSNNSRPWWKYEITAEKVKLEEVMNFSRQCAAFVRSGIPIVEALEVIGSECKDKLLRSILVDTAERIRNGASLSGALGLYTNALPNYYVPMIRSAEMTGRLDDVLDQVAEYLRRDIDARRRIRSALTYPIVVMMMSVVTVIVLAGWVLPKFQTFFNSLNAKLPLITRMLLGITDFIAQWYWLGAIILAATIATVLISGRTEVGRMKRDGFLLRLPGLGVVLRYNIVERFCRILGSMVQAGVPLPDAMLVAAESSTNAVYQRALSTVREAMMRGEGLARPIAATGLFPAGANQMLRVGEATGTLDQQLEAAASFYERELDYRLKRFTDLFEPAIILIVGFIVGFVAIALVSAMYGVFRQVNV